MKKFTLLILLILITFFSFLKPTFAKDYHFKQSLITVKALPDGSFEFEEKRTYVFDGSFRWADLTVYKTGSEGITNFQIKEGVKIYQLGSEVPNTVSFSDYPDRIYARWFYQAENEEKTFTISYKVLKAIKAYDDVAELCWKFIGKEWGKPTDHVEVTVILPAGALRKEVRAWGHGPLSGRVKIINPQTVKFNVNNLPANQMVEGRITFPPSLVPLAPRVKGERLPEILKEERAWAHQANLRRLVIRFQILIAILLIIFLFAFYVYFYIKYGKEYKPRFEGDYYRELPADYGPALAGFLYRFGETTSDDFTATIMDLARKKYLEIEEIRSKKTSLFGSKTERSYILRKQKEADFSLAEKERMALDFIFKKVGDNESCSLEMLKKFGKEHPETAIKFWNKWKETVRKEAEELDFIEEKSLNATSINIAVNSFVGALSFFVFVFTGNLLFFTVIPFAILFALLSGTLKRRSPQGVEEFAKWKAFRRFLTDFSRLKEALPSSIIVWEHYLVYAASLGVAEAVIRQLESVEEYLKIEKDETGYQPFFSFLYDSPGNFNLGSFTDFSSTFSSAMSSAFTPPSDSSGGGGGFSGGGGSGGGGGGGRAG